MADVIGQVLSLAVGVSLSPVPIMAVVLMLGTPAGRRNGPAFLAGWVIGLAVVGIGPSRSHGCRNGLPESFT
jgi:threonine/homoserine/homoserine lactone efflux protein